MDETMLSSVAKLVHGGATVVGVEWGHVSANLKQDALMDPWTCMYVRGSVFISHFVWYSDTRWRHLGIRVKLELSAWSLVSGGFQWWWCYSPREYYTLPKTFWQEPGTVTGEELTRNFVICDRLSKENVSYCGAFWFCSRYYLGQLRIAFGFNDYELVALFRFRSGDQYVHSPVFQWAFGD